MIEESSGLIKQRRRDCAERREQSMNNDSYAEAKFTIKDGRLREYHGDELDVVIPEGVTMIGFECFKNSKISSVTIPGSVRKIDSMAFSDCSNLQTVNISEGLETIGYRAFANCSSLKEITIPESVQNIEEYAFDCCYAIERVTMPAFFETAEIFRYSRDAEIVYLGKPSESEVAEIYREVSERFMIHCDVTNRANDTSDSGMGYDYNHSRQNDISIDLRDLVFRKKKLVGFRVHYGIDSDVIYLDGSREVKVTAYSSPRYEQSCVFTLEEKNET